MFRRILLRLALPVLMAVLLLPVAFAQSQDSQSVAEAARRAREKKKDASKPVKVITDETLDVKKGDVQSAAAEQPKMPGAPTSNPQGANAANPQAAPAAATANATKDGEKPKEPKEVTALREQIKQAASDLDLLQRQLRLDQEALYSKYDYKSDTAGIAKVDGEKQQVADKQQALDDLKAKLADLLKSLGLEDAATPTKP